MGGRDVLRREVQLERVSEVAVYVKSGPGKILMPDGTEIGVTFEPFEVKFDHRDGTHSVSYFVRPLKNSSITLPVEHVEGVEFG